MTMSMIKNSVSKVPFPFLVLFHDYWITFYNLKTKFYRPINLSNTDEVSQTFLANMWQKRSFQTISHNHVLTISIKNSMFFGSNMSRTKHKPLWTWDFLLCKKLWLTFWNIFFLKIDTRTRILLCKSHTQILKFLTVTKTM